VPTVPRYGVAEVAPTAQPDFRQSNNNANADDFGGSLGRGLQRLGQVFGGIAEEERKRAAETAVLGYEAETAQAESDVLTNPDTGALRTQGKDALNVTPTALQAWDKREAAALQQVPRYAQQRAKAIGQQRRVALETTLNRHTLQESERYTDSQADAVVSLNTDEAGFNYQDPGRIGDSLARIAEATKIRFRGASPEAQAAAIRANTSKAMMTVLGQHLLSGPDAGEAALKQYRTYLNADDALMFENRVQDARDSLASHTATAQAKRQAQAEHAVTFVQDAASTGIPLRPDALFEKSALVKGTDQEQPFAAAVAQMREVGQVRTRPFAEQQQYIDQLDAQLQQGSADPKHDKTRLDTLRSALESQRKLAKDSPILFWQNQGGTPVEPVNLKLGAAGVETALAGRFVQLGAMRKRFGPDVSMNPWRPEEGEALRTWLAAPERTVADKLTLLGAITKVAPDPQAVRDTLSPLALSDRVSYLAAMEQYANHHGERSGPVAPIILAGAKVLADKSANLPSEEKFQAAFDKDAGSAYPPGSQDRADAYTRFRTIYAGLSNTLTDRERTRVSTTHDLDETLSDTAMSLATGGLVEVQHRNVPKPYGMPDATFLDKLHASVDSAATRSGIPAEVLRDLPLQKVAGREGWYLLLNQGRAQLDPKTGKPLLLEVAK
jgi:hypothetical protein